MTEIETALTYVILRKPRSGCLEGRTGDCLCTIRTLYLRRRATDYGDKRLTE